MDRSEISKSLIRIFVIEDDEAMRSLLRDFVEGEGYQVELASDGSEAMKKLSVELFDVVITDVRMKGLTGLDILPGIKKIQPRASVIVITAFGSEEVQQRALERGAAAYLEKPIHLQHLRRVMEQVVSSKEKR